MKKILYILVGIILLYVILAFIGPSHVKFEKSIAINKPSEMVKKHTGDYQFFHDKWSPWTALDPKMTTKYSGTPGQIGHRYEWSGNSDVNTGAMELTAFNGDSIIQDLSFGERHTKTYYIVADSNGTTHFSWGVDMDVPFFFRPVMLFTDMGMNKRFDAGVNSLKKVMEEMEEEKANCDIKETEWGPVTYIGRKEVVPFDQMLAFFSKNLSAVYGALEKQKIEPQSPPSAIYLKYDEVSQKAEVAAVSKVPAETKIKDYEIFSYPASKVLNIAYYGDYSRIGAAHQCMQAYIDKKGLSQQGIIEEYVTDPMNEKDTAKWLTNIYYIVK